MRLIKLDESAFENKVYDDGAACLVVFGRKTCHVCEEVVPMVEEIVEEYKDKMNFYYVDVEEERDLYNRFSLRGVPQLVWFKDGEYQAKMAGLVEEDKVREKIEEVLD